MKTRKKSARNEMLSPSTDLKTSYDLSAPKWSTIGDGNRFSAQYRVRVTP